MKRCLILFELLVALSLVSVLLSVLFRFVSNSTKTQMKIEEARALLHQREHLHTRLSQLFTSLLPRSLLKGDTLSFYTLEQGGIEAVFDNGIDPDPMFSGPIKSRLSIEQNSLILTLSPLGETHSERKEVLLPNVKSINFQFLAKKDPIKPSINALPINRSAEWRCCWSKDHWDLPSLIRMTIEREYETLAFAFPLPFPDPPIIYEALK